MLVDVCADGWPDLAPSGDRPPQSAAEIEARASTSAKDLVERDLHRSGRQELKVSDSAAPAHRDALRRVLLAWCTEQPDYHQAMSHVAASLLVAASDESCNSYDAELTFQRFRLLMASLPGGFYDDGLRGCRVEVRTLWLLASDPQFFGDGKRNAQLLAPSLRGPLELVATQWLLTIMAGVLPLACTHRLWQRMMAGTGGATTTEANGSDGDATAPVQPAPPSDLPLRVAIALLGALSTDLAAAAEADAADAAANASAHRTDADSEGEGGESFGSESYLVLQQAAQRIEPLFGTDGAFLLVAADRVHLSAETAQAARMLACAQLEAEGQAEAQRKAERRQRRQRWQPGASTSTSDPRSAPGGRTEPTDAVAGLDRPSAGSGDLLGGGDSRRVAVGMVFILASGVIFSVMSALTRVVSDAGMPTMQIVFISGVVRWSGLALLLWRRRLWPIPARARSVRILVLRSLCGCIAFSCATYGFGGGPAPP